MSKKTRLTEAALSGQQGLFDTGLAEGGLDISLGFRQCLSRVLSSCGKERYVVAAEISHITNWELSKPMLDKYCGSDLAYRFPAEALSALCHTTGSFEVMRYLAEPIGAEVVTPDDMRYLKLARLEEQRRKIDQEMQLIRVQCGIK